MGERRLVTADRLWIGAGRDVIDHGVVLSEDGVITAVGSRLRRQWQSVVVHQDHHVRQPERPIGRDLIFIVADDSAAAQPCNSIEFHTD